MRERGPMTAFACLRVERRWIRGGTASASAASAATLAVCLADDEWWWELWSEKRGREGIEGGFW